MIGTIWRNKNTGRRYTVTDVKNFDGVEVIVFKLESTIGNECEERWEKNRFMKHWEIIGY